MSLSVPALGALIATSALSSALAVWALRPAAPPPPPPPTPVVCRCEVAIPATAAPPATPSLPQLPPPIRTTAPGPQGCRGMTWSLLKQQRNVVRVGSDPAHTNAYAGDTACETELSILCLRPKNLPKPEGLASDYYNGWSGAEVAATKPLAGTLLTSRAAADALCAKALGDGWRMAEHHDGHGGWGLSGLGELPRDARFWVAIDDQPANPWNTR